MYHWKFTVPLLFLAAAILLGWAIVDQNSDRERGKEVIQPETMPLVPMMQQLLTDLQQVDRGIYTENFEMVEEGAGRISDHPVMTPKDKKLVKETLGEQMQQFVEFDRIVHHHADSMRMAAVEKNMQKVLEHYRITQQGCVDCHTAFRSDIVEARK